MLFDVPYRLLSMISLLGSQQSQYHTNRIGSGLRWNQTRLGTVESYRPKNSCSDLRKSKNSINPFTFKMIVMQTGISQAVENHISFVIQINIFLI